MATLLQAKQINKFTFAKIGSSGFSGAGVDDVVTAAITAAASVDNVPVQVGSSTALGFITTGANNKALVLNSTNKSAIEDGAGNEVYARLTEAAGVYTLSYYSLVAGIETAYSLPATTIDFYVNYSYSFILKCRKISKKLLYTTIFFKEFGGFVLCCPNFFGFVFFF